MTVYYYFNNTVYYLFFMTIFELKFLQDCSKVHLYQPSNFGISAHSQICRPTKSPRKSFF